MCTLPHITMASSSDEVTGIDSVDISQATTASPSTQSSGQVVRRNESKVWTSCLVSAQPSERCLVITSKPLLAIFLSFQSCFMHSQLVSHNPQHAVTYYSVNTRTLKAVCSYLSSPPSTSISSIHRPMMTLLNGLTTDRLN